MQSLPTDNLYKFIALVGVALIFYSVYFFEKKSAEYELMLVNVKAEINAPKSAAKIRIIYAEYLRSALRKSINSNKLDRLPIIYKELKVIHEEEITLNKQIMKLEVVSGELHMLKKITTIGLVAGLFITILGFILWYKKVQLPLDSNAKNHLIIPNE